MGIRNQKVGNVLILMSFRNGLPRRPVGPPRNDRLFDSLIFCAAGINDGYPLPLGSAFGSEKSNIPKWQLMKSKSPRNHTISRTFGTAEGIRTPDLLVRSQSLYPTELQPHILFCAFLQGREKEKQKGSIQGMEPFWYG